MADEQFPVDQENVGLDAAKALIEGVEEGPLVLVIVVSVHGE